jgi:hypothetical protein
VGRIPVKPHYRSAAKTTFRMVGYQACKDTDQRQLHSLPDDQSVNIFAPRPQCHQNPEIAPRCGLLLLRRSQPAWPYEIFGPIRSTPPKVGNRRERRIVLPVSSPNGKSAFVPEERSDSSRALDSFPIAQEALRNAVKYSGAREFTVDLAP